MTGACGASPATSTVPTGDAVAQEVDVERPGRLAAAVEDHRDVAAGLDAHVAHDQVRPRVGLPADRRGRPLGAHRPARAVAPAEVDDRAVAGGRQQLLDGLVVRVLAERRRRRDPRRRSRARRPCATRRRPAWSACSVKRICIFAALRNVGTRPSKTASRASRSQLTSVALPYGDAAAVRAAGASRQNRATRDPVMRPQRIMRAKNPARHSRVAPKSSRRACLTSTGSVRSRTCTSWRS